MFHGHLPPDRARIEGYNADQDRETRRRGAQGMLLQFAALCILCVVAIALLVLVSLIL
jgi:hypothetical protein